MKTIKHDHDVYAFIDSYPKDKAIILHKVVEEVSKITQEKPALWGKDIIGFGNMTYSNTYVKDQPYFVIGFRLASKHMTFYLNGYQENLMAFADAHHIKHGQGCYHLKKPHENLEIVKKLITLSKP